jgi:Holliday junction resolvase RusA-like endonuclease
MNRITFFVPGEPKAQPRVKARSFTTKAGQQITSVYTPKTASYWKSAVQQWARPAFAKALGAGHAPLEGKLLVSIAFFFERPQLRKKDPPHPLPHPVKPDRDNCEKTLDCLTDSKLWADDAQVCAGAVSKWYVARPGFGAYEQPGAFIMVEVLDDEAWFSVTDQAVVEMRVMFKDLSLRY